MNTILGEKSLRTAQVTESCRRRLWQYADSLCELADCCGREEGDSHGDRQEVIAGKRLWENCQVIRGSLKRTAKLMREAAAESMRYRPMEERKKRLITQAMHREGIRVEDPCYVERGNGKFSILLTLSSIKRAGIAAEEVTDMLSVLLDRRLVLSAASPYLVEREPKGFLLEDEPPFAVLTGFSGAARESERVSGDNYAVIERSRGRIDVMLSDGTGSGEKAEAASEKVLELMEKMLEAGCSEGDAISMVNGALAAEGGDDNHPTLDLCSVDLYGGTCEIRKAGGAATFLKRAKQVEVLQSPCLPLGIFGQQETEPICEELKDGDYLVMVTDGVLDAFGEEDYGRMRDFLSGMTEQNPGEIAEKVLRGALCASGGRIRDDMTVGVIGLWEN